MTVWLDRPSRQLLALVLAVAVPMSSGCRHYVSVVRTEERGAADGVASALSGVWRGTFRYPRGARPDVPFTLDLRCDDGGITGTGTEPRSDAGPQHLAEFTFSVSGKYEPSAGTLLFTKSYDFDAPSVRYEGRLDAGARRVRGTWAIDSYVGSFEMDLSEPPRTQHVSGETRRVVSGVVSAECASPYVVEATHLRTSGTVQIEVRSGRERVTVQDYTDQNPVVSILAYALGLHTCLWWMTCGDVCVNSQIGHRILVDFFGAFLPIVSMPGSQHSTEVLSRTPADATVEDELPTSCSVSWRAGGDWTPSAPWRESGLTIDRQSILDALARSPEAQVEVRLTSPEGSVLATSSCSIPPIVSISAQEEQVDALAGGPLRVSVRVFEAAGRDVLLPPIDVGARLLDGASELWRIACPRVNRSDAALELPANLPGASGSESRTLSREGTFTLEIYIVDPAASHAEGSEPPGTVARTQVVVRDPYAGER